MSLYEVITKSQQGDSEAILHILNKFDITLNKFARQLEYPEAKTDLTITLITSIKSFDKSKFSVDSEGQLINYIYSILKNKKIDLHRARINKIKEINLDLQIYNPIDTKVSIDDTLLVKDLLSELTPRQQEIMTLKFIHGYKESEIAKALQISRQAVYKLKVKSLNTLRSKLLVFC